MFASLMRQDDALVVAGFPPLSPWWRATFEAFLLSGKRFLVERVGRRGGKSSSNTRFAVNEALNGRYKIPPGDVGYWAFISTKREEAAARIITVKAVLDALRVKYSPTENGIVIQGMNIGFRVYVASIAGVSGPTLIGFNADEMAKWKDADTGANPAREVLTSLKPALAGVPRSKGILASSPFSTLDVHAEAVAAGDTPSQAVAIAPTWIARPALTEAETHELEPDEQTWRREYAAEPMTAGESTFFDAAAVDAAAEMDAIPDPAPGSLISAGADFAFVRNHAGLCIANHEGEGRHELVKVIEAVVRVPPLKPSVVVKDFADRLKAHGVDCLMADGHYRMSISEHLEQENLGFILAPNSPAEPFVRSRVLLNDGRLKLMRKSPLVRQMKLVMGAPTPNGLLRIILPTAPDGSHLDLISAMVLAVYNRAGRIVENKESLEDPTKEAFMERWQAEMESEQQGVDWLQRRYR